VFERFTDRARRVVVLAQEESRLLNHEHIGTEHILLGLLHDADGVAAKALGISLEEARERLEGIAGPGSERAAGHIPFTRRAKKILELSLREALRYEHNYIGPEHLFLGLIREGQGVGMQVLAASGVEVDAVRARVLEIIAAGSGAPSSAEPGAEWELQLEAGAAVGPLSEAVAGAFDEPFCPRCRAPLARTARVASFDVPGTSGAAHTVRFVFCSACGETLLAADS
jgi:ATP-dependent Clp protease ATP-binding subunit ClpC